MDMGPEWEALEKEWGELEAWMHEVRKKRKVIASNKFLEFLQKGKWVFENYDLTPADSKTERIVVGFLSDLMDLGYHDSFSIESNNLSFYGRVDDGRLSISMDISSRAAYYDACSELKTIKVDVDIKSMFLERLEYSLRDEEDTKKRAQKAIDQLKLHIVALKNE